ncbi:MAG: hypothetical protein ACRENU_13340 [Gemmatimonadaceae bacterium]
MSRFTNFTRACVIAVVASAVACSSPTGPVSKTRHDGPTVQGFGANAVTALGVSSSPSVQGVGTSPRPQP